MLLTICWVKDQTLELYGEKWRTCSLYLVEPRREVDPVEARLLPSMHFTVFWFPNCVHIKYPESNNSLLLDGEKLKNLASQLFQIKGFIWEHCWMVSRRAPPDRKQSHPPLTAPPPLHRAQENSLSGESCTWPKKAGRPCGAARTEGQRGI